MPDDDLLLRLRRFQDQAFPSQRSLFRHLVDDGQHPTTLFIGCSDSRIVPYLLTGAGPGELFLVRNVGAFVPPYDQSQGFHGTAAAIEFAVLNLNVERIVICGHTHCGAVRALYGEVPAAAQNLARWLELGREARLPVAEPGPDVLRRTEQRAIVLQLERLMDYPMVRERVEAGTLSLHGWHYVIEDGEIHVFDILQGGFVPAAQASNAGTGPYRFSEDFALDAARLASADDAATTAARHAGSPAAASANELPSAPSGQAPSTRTWQA